MKCNLSITLIVALATIFYQKTNSIIAEEKSNDYGKNDSIDLDNRLVTIEEAISLAKNHANEYQKRILELDIAKQDLYMGYTGFLPNINFTLRKEHYDVKQINADRSFISNFESFNIDQSIALYKTIPKALMAHKEYEAQQKNFLENEKEIEIKVIQNYTDIYRSAKTIWPLKEIEEIITKQIEINEIRFKHDNISYATLISLKAKLSETRAERIRIQNQLEISLNNYYLLTGYKHKNLQLEEKFIPYDNMELFISNAMHVNSKIKSVEASVGKAKFGLVVKSTDLLPDLRIGYSKNKYKNLWYMPGTPDMTHDILRFEMVMPIFDSGQKIIQTTRAMKELRLATVNLLVLKDQLTNDISNAWSAYQVSYDIVKQYEESMHSFHLNHEQKQTEFKNNLGSYYQVLEAKKEELRANINLINSKVDRVVKFYKLSYYLK